MIKISEVVFETIQGDEIALEAFRMDLLNLSAYADRIRTIVSEKAYKVVNKGSIVTALSRMRKELGKIPPLRSIVRIENMSIKSPHVEISFEKTTKAVQLASQLDSKSLLLNSFYTIIYGVGEISLICSENLKKQVLSHFSTKPKGVYNNLVAITVRFIEQDYIETPNMIYTLVSALASKRINIIEIISTFTEISFIVREKDMKETIDVLKCFFHQKK